jgi:hypothetical protein
MTAPRERLVSFAAVKTSRLARPFRRMARSSLVIASQRISRRWRARRPANGTRRAERMTNNGSNKRFHRSGPGPMASTESPDSPPHFASTIIPSERLDFGSQIMRTDPMLSDVNGSDGKEGRSGDREGRPPRPAGMSLSKWWKISIGGSPASGRAVAADQKKRFPCHRPCSRQKWTERAVERRVNYSAAIPFICHRTDKRLHLIYQWTQKRNRQVVCFVCYFGRRLVCTRLLAAAAR